MKAAALLIVMVSNQGYWFGDQPASVAVRWAIMDRRPSATLTWELTVDGLSLAQGSAELDPKLDSQEIHVVAPPVRVRTPMMWRYRVLAGDGRAVISQGEEAVDIFPRDLLADFAKRLEGKSIYVWDDDHGIPALLAAAGVPFTRLDTRADLQLIRADIILVGEGQLHGRLGAQAALLGHAEAGAGVMIFYQSEIKELAGYGLAPRPVGPTHLRPTHAGQPAQPAAPALIYQLSHPLLRGFLQRDVLAAESGPHVPHKLPRVEGVDGPLYVAQAVRLPADEPALELIYWPREAPGTQAAPIDALLLTRTIGSGRLILCQWVLGTWDRDPRRWMLLGNALDYLSTRPQPTPPPNQRRPAVAPPTPPVPSITVPRGSES